MDADRRPYDASTAPAVDPRPRVTNPPGQSAIEYRVGTYATFLEATLRGFARARVGHRDAPQEPLATLNLGGAHNFAMGIAQAWAAVGDVLTFYQDRIANEGFLRTATDHAAIARMVRALGYQPSPGLAASTHLAFTVFDARQAPRSVTVPEGTSVQSVPLSGGMPQVFETSADIVAHAEFNAVPAALGVTSVVQRITNATREITVRGAGLAIRKGDQLLVVGMATDETGQARWLLRVTSVQADTRMRITRIGFDAVAPDGPVVEITDPMIVRMQRSTRIFGANAAPWAKLPESAKRAVATIVGPVHITTDWGASWAPVDAGLAEAPVRCLAVSPDGDVFAGIAGKGVFRLPSGGSTWQSASDGLTRMDVHALAFDDRGNIVAGTARGGVFRTTDGARTWEPVGSAAPRLRFEDGKIESVVMPGVPDTVVRTVAAFEHVSPEGDRFDRIWIGTDAGAFRTMEVGDSWEPISNGLPGTDAKTGVTGTAVRSLLVVGRERFAGTDSGVYRWHGRHDGWQSCSTGLPVDGTRGPARVRSLTSVTRPDGHVLVLAATENGVWALPQPFETWRHSSVGIPDGVNVHAVASTHGAIHERPVVIAATASGVYRSLDGGATWSVLPAALAAPLFHVGLDLVAALDAGGSVPDTVRKAFRAHSLTLEPTASITVVEASQAWRIVEPERHRLFELTKGGTSIDVSFLRNRAHVVAIAGDGTMAVSSVRSPILEDEWPHFRVGPHSVDLMPVAQSPKAGSWLVIEQDGIGPPEAFLVAESVDATRSAFGRSGSVTTVTLDRPIVDLFDRRLATVFLESSRLALDVATISSPEPVTGSTISLAGVLDGVAAGSPIAVKGKPSSAPVARLGGVRRLTGSSWTTLGLASRGARRVVVCADRSVLAITGVGSVVRLSSATEASDPELIDGLAAEQATALAVVDGRPMIGTASGAILRLRADGSTFDPVRTPSTSPILSFAIATSQTLYAGSESHGILRSLDGGTTWTRVGQELPSRMASIAGGPGDFVIAGGPDGIVVSTDAGTTWTSRSVGLRDTNVLSVAVAASGTLLAGTHDGGVFVRSTTDTVWRRWDDGLPSRPVRSLALDPSGANVFATCVGGGVFHAPLGASGWQALTPSLSNQVEDVVVLTDGSVVVAATAGITFYGSDGRAAFSIRTDRMGTIAPVLSQDLDLGRTSAAVRDALGVIGATVSAASRVRIAKPGAAWIVEDDGMALSIESGTTGLDVFSVDNGLDVAGGPKSSGGGLLWTLRDRLGRTGMVGTSPGEILPGPACVSTTPASEIAFVSSATVAVDSGTTTIALTAPLQCTYDPSTVAVCLNVAIATHGETVSSEVLGSGSPRKAFQHFELKRPPLTWLFDPKAPNGVRETLRVSVSSDPQGALTGAIASPGLVPAEPNQVHWKLTPSLALAGPNDRVFTLRRQTHDRTIVTFGDGVHGARLPKGMENVRARYRSGIGTVGNVPENALSHIPVRPLGIRRVTNPVAATGGVDPESWNDARWNAPRSLRTFGGVVSTEDYADFAMQFPGIEKATVVSVWNGRHRVLVVSVLRANGVAISASDPLLQELDEAIRGVRTSARPFRVVPAELKRFRLAAQLEVEHGHEIAKARKKAKAHIASAFTFDRRDLAESVEATWMTALLQAVQGVVSVILTAFHLEGDSPYVAERIVAHNSRWNRRLEKCEGADWLQPDLNHSVTFDVSQVKR